MIELMKRGTKITMAVCILIGAIGCADRVVKNEVEKTVTGSLPNLIGPADSYSVRASGSGFRIINGHIRGLTITGTNVHLRAGVTLATMEADISDIALDTHTRQIRSIGATEFSGSMSQTELTRYLASRYPKIPALKVELGDNLATISVRPGISGFSMGISASAAVQVRSETIVGLDLKSLKVAGLSTPSIAREALDPLLDSLFDANDLGVDAKVKSATVTPGYLHMTGTLDLMKAMEKLNADR